MVPSFRKVHTRYEVFDDFRFCRDIFLTVNACSEDCKQDKVSDSDTSQVCSDTNIIITMTNVIITMTNVTSPPPDTTTGTPTTGDPDERENAGDCLADTENDGLDVCNEDTEIGTCVECNNNDQCSGAGGCCDPKTFTCVLGCEMTTSTGPT
jgi:hypothetical protein